MISQPVCRLAPSPTGAQHLGNARTFLIAYWSARAQNAQLILRIEDIDSPRVKPWATQQAIDDLRWLGIDWDGDPIIQTQRTELYATVIDRLLNAGRLYPCTCSRKDIETAASAPHESSRGDVDGLRPDAPVYPGTCSTWQTTDPLPNDREFCLRYRITTEPMRCNDLVHGEVACHPANSIGDFPITRKGRSLGECLAAYQLAVVVDDVEAGVTEVVRGDDLLLSMFRQKQIYDSLEQPAPGYAHVPLVTGNDGRRLAKRHGDTRLSHLRDQGVSPESIVAWAAESSGLLALSERIASERIESERDLARLDLASIHDRMIATFDWSNVSNQPTIVPVRWSLN